MFLSFGKRVFGNKCIRPYSYHARPIDMVSNTFEGKNIDNTKTPLIIMHGLFGSKQNWRAVSRAVAEKCNRKIYTIDARNHGDSPHTDEHSSMHMAIDVVEFLNKNCIKQASVMGHSMGGRTMMFLALKYV